MTQFRGKFVNKLDAKARVSVPASFRALVGGNALVLRRSTKHPCIEAWPPAAFADAVPATGPLAETTDEDDDIAYAMLADVTDVSFDPEGRMVLPRELMEHANLSAAVTFLGTRDHFQLWEPEAAEARIAASRAALAARRARPAAEDGA